MLSETVTDPGPIGKVVVQFVTLPKARLSGLNQAVRLGVPTFPGFCENKELNAKIKRKEIPDFIFVVSYDLVKYTEFSQIEIDFRVKSKKNLCAVKLTLEFSSKGKERKLIG